MPDVIDYSAFINARVRGRVSESALHLVDEMRHRDMVPNWIAQRPGLQLPCTATVGKVAVGHSSGTSGRHLPCTATVGKVVKWCRRDWTSVFRKCASS